MMQTTHEEQIATLANDLFNKRQRFIAARQAQLFDPRPLESVAAEYRQAESEYQQAKAAFARAMKAQ